MVLQIQDFDTELKNLQQEWGNPNICFINGAGCIDNPKLLLLFMNPTAKNITANKEWTGLRAPWIGTKNIWKMLYGLNLIGEDQFKNTQKLKPSEWRESLAKDLYMTLAVNKVYMTNLAKCTQDDARPLPNKVFKKYLELTKQEIIKVNPEKIISFGVQVSSIILDKKVEIKDTKEEKLIMDNKEFKVYPTYYPVGQGMRNMSKAVERITKLL